MAIEGDSAVFAEIAARHAGFGVERVEILAAHRDDARVRAASPIRHAARALSGCFLQRRPSRLLDPDRTAGGGIKRLDQADTVGRIQHAVDHDGRAPKVVRWNEVGELLQHLRIDRGPAPDGSEILDVLTIDLIESGVPCEALVSTIGPPLAARGWLSAATASRHGHGA